MGGRVEQPHRLGNWGTQKRRHVASVTPLPEG